MYLKRNYKVLITNIALHPSFAKYPYILKDGLENFKILYLLFQQVCILKDGLENFKILYLHFQQVCILGHSKWITKNGQGVFHFLDIQANKITGYKCHPSHDC